MNKTEIQAKVSELLESGVSRKEVFTQLSGQGVKDAQLAYFILAHADPRRCHDHDRKVNILITLMLIQAVIGLLIGFAAGAKIGPNAKWIFAALGAAIPLLLAYGIYRHRVGYYNAYIILSIVQLPKSLEGFTAAPIATSIGFLIVVALMAFVWYVREQLFPGFAFIGPKKVKGEYVFPE